MIIIKSATSLPEIPPRSLVLGFAFSMTPEGLPGSYNEKLAAQLTEIISAASALPANERPWIGVQWEIFDALEAAWDRSWGELLQWVSLSHVGAPPRFQNDDILNANAIVRFVQDCHADCQAIQNGRDPRAPTTRAGRVLAQQIVQLLAGQSTDDSFFHRFSLEPSRITQCFNRILELDDFHGAFYDAAGRPLLELHDLYRTQVGSVGVESRVLPAASSRLRRFQRLRVNRLILEAIFPHQQVLKPGQYLSTGGVLSQLFAAARDEMTSSFEHAFLFAHPAHSPRCRRQFLDSNWCRSGKLDADHVQDVNSGKDPEWKWDPTTAQMCCRSRENWDDYERMHQAQWE